MPSKVFTYQHGPVKPEYATTLRFIVGILKIVGVYHEENSL